MNAQLYVQLATWSQVVASVLFIGVLMWLWVRFIQPAIMAAQERANKQIAEAERHRDEAKAMLELLQGEANGARRDADAIRERAAEHAKREYEAAVTEAKGAGERALTNAAAEPQRARAAAREQLRGEMLDSALRRAREQASRRVDAATNTRLVDQFLGSLEA